LAKSALKQAAITRAAFEYQDLVGIEVLINFFRDPALYHWVELESEEPSGGYLDDVVAARKDGSFEYIQVKFTVDPDRFLLDWDWLLERKPRGTSRLKKWADTIFDLQLAGPLFSAELRTNRKPDLDFGRALNGDRIIYGRIYVVIDGLDHVWREQMNIEQMNHLFNYLLPCPKNVFIIVGTQRVADTQLPSRLLTHASPTAWIEVPPMDERAVQDWVDGQNKAGRLRLAHRPRDKDERYASLGNLPQGGGGGYKNATKAVRAA
jgi:hypothetical protein